MSMSTDAAAVAVLSSVLNFAWLSCCQLRTEGPAMPQGKMSVTDMHTSVEQC